MALIGAPRAAGLLVIVASMVFTTADVQNRDSAGNSGREFKIENDQFYKDGLEFRILGGSLHYFRVHPKYWEDRLLRLKALGLNTVQTYVPWNLHQPQPDRVTFEENTFADLGGFLKIAQKLHLLVMLRPGPYICGEWDFGGFPAWLLATEPALKLRTSDADYLSLVDRWWDILMERVLPFLYSKGGPIIMVQIENEYGSFGDDQVYMNHLVDRARFHLGDEVILYTTDAADAEFLERGSVHRDDVYTAVDFPVEWDAEAASKVQKQFNAPGKSPFLSSEFYTGWLTHWGEPLARTDSLFVAAALDKILRLNGSVVFYVAHGGTNFGFNSGANTGDTAYDFIPDITSYDYDAPISEDGSCDNPKFRALRDVLSNYSHAPLPNFPPRPFIRDYGSIQLFKLSSLFGILDSVSLSPTGIPIDAPCPMELLGQVSGLILYRSILPDHITAGSKLFIPELHDRAQIFVTAINSSKDGKGGARNPIRVGIFERWSNSSIQLDDAVSVPGLQLDILVRKYVSSQVENMGRINYGPYIDDRKGILSGVFIDGIPLFEWTAYPIPLEEITNEASTRLYDGLHVRQHAMLSRFGKPQGNFQSELLSDDWMTEGPSFYGVWINLDEHADTYVSLRGWSKGVVFINGFNLGRFWPVKGPQCSLYIPAPVLLTGRNEVIIFELEEPSQDLTVTFSEAPDFSCGQRSAFPKSSVK